MPVHFEELVILGLRGVLDPLQTISGLKLKSENPYKIITNDMKVLHFNPSHAPLSESRLVLRGCEFSMQ